MRAQGNRAAEANRFSPPFSKAGFAYETLRRQILDGTLRAGERLRLTHLAQQLELSEMPVREALRLLQKDGLVQMELHRGAQVAALSLDRAYEIIEVRTALECLAALSALPRHDRHSVARLERLLAGLAASLDDTLGFAIKNRALLAALYERTPNEFLRQHIQDLWDQVWRFSSTLVFDFMPERLAATVTENRAILEAVGARDGRLLRRLLERRRRDILAGWRRAIERAAQAGGG
jgi:DNA-binding GntR family transcriptional regulator